MRRGLFAGLCLAALAVYLGFAAIVYLAASPAADSYRAVSATLVATDSSSSAYAYTYTYRVGDRLCRGSSISEPYPTDSPTVYYDTKDVCSSVTTDPAATRGGLLLIWLSLGLWFATMAIVWRLTTPRPGGATWQAS